jgi:hypothetical protein
VRDVDRLDSKEKNAVVHHVDTAWCPNYVGTDQVRYFTLSGNRLTIRSPPAVLAGEMGTGILVWEKVK